MPNTKQQPLSSDQPRLSQQDLGQFTGDIIRYTHPLNRKLIYTPGVRHVAEAGQAYWLIDAIASYFGSGLMNAAIEQDERLANMQFWKLVVNADGAVLTGEADAGEQPFVRQVIPYTDFPLEQIDIWAAYDGSYWTLYLPSEH